jgi:hypothetical protein
MKKLPLFVMIITLAGCATIGSSPKLTYAPEVRKQSCASNNSFHDLVATVRGVGHADEVAYPNAKERTLVRIEVILPYDNQKLGSERWTVRHDANQVAVYQVTLVPDGEGSADFTVSKAQ